MTGRRVWLCASLACIGTLGVLAMTQEKPGPVSQVLMFDDFSGAAGTPPDANLWTYALGGGGWGNNEAQVYTANRDNVRVDGAGHLVIEARAEADGYTSARLVTLDRFAFTHGRAEARIKLPRGQGLHPAFWLMGTDIERVGWPQSGEIDVIETINNADFSHSALHGPSTDGTTWKSEAEGSEQLSDEFHNYWVERSDSRIVVGIDESVTGVFDRDSLEPGQMWVFEKPFFLLFNVAVGGNWPGDATPGTSFPATMLVDWVKVTDE